MSKRSHKGGQSRRGVEDYHLPRWSLPLPPERLAGMPFVLDAAGMTLIAPWPPDRLLQPADAARLQAALARFNELDDLPDGPCWLWPDRERPTSPIGCSDAGPWLAGWSRSRAVYRLIPEA